MAVVAIVPLDVYSTLDNSKPSELGVMWNVAFWSTQILTWLLLPFFQYYSDAGDFTVKGKCITSLKENAILYGSVAAVGLIGVAALLISKKMTIDGLMGLGIGLSNAFGLIASIILLGYGLIPRNLWKADPERQLKWCAHRAGKYAEKVMKSTAELETVVTIIAANERQMRRHDPLRKYMDIIVEHVEKESPIKPSDLVARGTASGRSSGGIDIESLNAEDLEYNYDVAGLAALRRRMFYAISTYKGITGKGRRGRKGGGGHERGMRPAAGPFAPFPGLRAGAPARAPWLQQQLGWLAGWVVWLGGDRAQYEEVMLEAFELEDVVKCRQLNEFTPRKPTRSPIKKVVWFYKCALRAHWHRVLAVVFACMSVLIVWAEATIVSPVDISPLSLMIKGSEANEFGVQLITLLPLAYICACTYAALFSITAFDYNKLIPRATIGSSLMQNGTLMCRFAAPTCWNFYHMVRMTNRDKNDGVNTVFEDKMGSMAVPAFLSQHLNTYLPLILVVECVITALNLWDRIMGLCVSSKYKFSNDDDVDDEYTEKGRQLVAREREAVEKGFTIGQVLTSAFFDLDFPDIVGGPRSRLTQQKKGGFLGLFGKKSAPATTAAVGAPPPLAAPQRPGSAPSGSGPSGTAPRYKSSTAAAAAARWLGRGAGLPDDSGVMPSAGSTSAVLDTTSAKASLLASRQYDKSPGGEYDAPGQKSGLDGIFATLSGVGGADTGGGGVSAGSMTAAAAAGGVVAGAGNRLGGGVQPDTPGAQRHSEKDSLLAGFWRS
ncbi:hypothetical protein VOLCADRAFT_98436 [Volvox carteri f. nagariensis]|uniref:LMBR1-like membrane protein n=1 Tax=Volvox carteri f. nagariensis TaxID=3068 RepID=D8UFC0_VOLCA|nr:uncharacterized protein VOLCADRAFT_98436 [Volvox carteri f. nagariensis]EFJ41548.1 hypothetical protein VOLCADRAFT_98436 [Volvox carteri f. nagariensis]|eukprot:XP_002957339.1 hypothetical protein VOLCADRAFT_98436 [Volvox carteri f. nagariensis]